ncbi:MAG: TolC family protein [Gemmatimonadaceae bacterium]|nr:TolC family protein [Gemmatimonadaceae bacterium]
MTTRPLILRLAVLAIAIAPTARGSAQAGPGTDTVRISLDDALRRAGTIGEEARIARANVGIAGTQVKAARSAALPSLDGSFTYLRTYASPFQTKPSSEPVDSSLAPLAKMFANLPFGRVNQYTANLTATQTIYSPRLGSALRIANHFEGASQMTLREQLAETEYQVRAAYARAQLAAELEASAREAVEQAQRFLDQEKLRVQAGTSSDLDLLRAEVALENLKPQLVDAQNAAAIASLDMKRLVNVPAAAPIVLTTHLDPPRAASAPAANLGTAADDRPAVKAEEQQVNIAKELVKQAIAAYIPGLDFRMSFGRLMYPLAVWGLNGRDWLTDWNASLTVKVPIFNGFKRGADLTQARLGLEQEQLRLAQLRESVQMQYEQARGERARAAASVDARQRTVDQAQKVYDLTVLRYDQGLATHLDVSDARLGLLTARSNFAQAVAQYYIADAGLQRALGISSAALNQAR